MKERERWAHRQQVHVCMCIVPKSSFVGVSKIFKKAQILKFYKNNFSVLTGHFQNHMTELFNFLLRDFEII